MKTCCRCKTPKSESEFGSNKSNADGLQKYCRMCKRGIAKTWYNSSCKTGHIIHVRKNNTRYRKAIEDVIWDYLKQHPCELCGDNDIIALDFDHLDPSKKEFNISELMYRTTKIEKVLKEISKCRVLCGKCHRIETAKQLNTWKYRRVLMECSRSSNG